MTKLTSEARRRLPKKAFAVSNEAAPGKSKPGGHFPIPDKAHATAALRLLPRALRKGTVTAAQGRTVRARAKAKLGRGGLDAKA